MPTNPVVFKGPIWYWYLISTLYNSLGIEFVAQVFLMTWILEYLHQFCAIFYKFSFILNNEASITCVIITLFVLLIVKSFVPFLYVNFEMIIT